MWDRIQKQFDARVMPQKALAFWHADPGTLKLVNQGINIVYRFESEGEGRYMRLTNASLRSKQQVEAAVDFLQHLYTQGCSVCRPVASKSGLLIEEVLHQGQHYLATAVQEVPGGDLGLYQTRKEVYQAWGYALGQIHRASQSYKPRGCDNFLTWRDLDAEVKGHIQNVEPEIQEVYHKVARWLQTLPEDKSNFGLTHADFRPGNAFWDGKKVSIIDFDEPVYHWFMADVARAMLEFADHSQRGRFFEWFLLGYREVKTLDGFWADQLDLFIRMKDLDLYTWILHCWEGPQIPGGESREETLHKIRARLLRFPEKRESYPGSPIDF